MEVNKNDIEYFVNQKSRLSLIEMTKFIEEIDLHLIDPIKTRDYFISYIDLAKKYYEEAYVIFSLYQDTKIVGLSAIYANPNSYKYAYESFIGVLESFSNNGIGSQLMNREILLCRELGMKGIMTNCNPENRLKIKLNIKLGFHEINDDDQINTFNKMNSRWIGKKYFIYDL